MPTDGAHGIPSLPHPQFGFHHLPSSTNLDREPLATTRKRSFDEMAQLGDPESGRLFSTVDQDTVLDPKASASTTMQISDATQTESSEIESAVFVASAKRRRVSMAKKVLSGTLKAGAWMACGSALTIAGLYHLGEDI